MADDRETSEASVDETTSPPTSTPTAASRGQATGGAHWYNNNWFVSVVVAVVFLFLGFQWSELQQSKEPKRLGEAGTISHFVVRVNDFDCKRAMRRDDPLTDEVEAGSLDYQACRGPMTALNTSDQSDSLYLDATLSVSGDRYTHNDNAFPLGTDDVFPNERGEGELYFEIAVGAVPTKLTLRSGTSEGILDAINPFDRNSLTYDLR